MALQLLQSADSVPNPSLAAGTTGRKLCSLLGIQPALNKLPEIVRVHSAGLNRTGGRMGSLQP